MDSSAECEIKGLRNPHSPFAFLRFLCDLLFNTLYVSPGVGMLTVSVYLFRTAKHA